MIALKEFTKYIYRSLIREEIKVKDPKDHVKALKAHLIGIRTVLDVKIV